MGGWWGGGARTIRARCWGGWGCWILRCYWYTTASIESLRRPTRSTGGYFSSAASTSLGVF
ncbi:hypothetical protein B0H19DRAFT_1168131 [Mycena capillaripes]|nr:hypothetical protein B0H19DRAFT_1168131 [Mycena capillaripes]